jgi:myo-inositol 2-dehydrogenase/D-chiro-inositol 1-dehydrogenase
MSIGIGVVGTGIMGADHASTISRRVPSGFVAAVADPDASRLEAAVRGTGAGKAYTNPIDLIEDPKVEAVIVASPDQTHAELVRACLRAQKPVLCEKPLAPSPEECLGLVEQEASLGRRLITVGFMRRFDPSYRAMKSELRQGRLGAPLLFHCIHRGTRASTPATSDMIITAAAVHEIDITRWLFESEIVRCRVFNSRRQTESPIRNPQFLVLENESGVLITIEVFSSVYGYDVRGEVVCDRGTIMLSDPREILLRLDGHERRDFYDDWRPRFATAYQDQMSDWIKSITGADSEEFDGATAWDGYVAASVADACLRSTTRDQDVDIELSARPEIYS